MLITDYPAIVRAEGLSVKVESGFATRSHGELQRNPPYIVWHHDASPIGPTPGIIDWMISAWNEASANIWVDYYGVWHFVGAGIAWHAGATLPGMPTNQTAIGIETDYTVGEKISPVLYDSLRRGTAAIFRAMKQPSTDLHFHKTICSPVGRKSDPWGFDLATERAAVAALVAGTVKPLAPVDTAAPQGAGGADPREWDEMASKDEIKAAVRELIFSQEFLQAVAVTMWTTPIAGKDRAANQLLLEASSADDALASLGDIPVKVWTQLITDKAANVLLAEAADSPKS